MPKVKVNVVQKPDEPPIERNILAQAIVDISVAVKRLSASGLTRDAIIILAHERCRAAARPSKKQIREVLDSLESLQREFVR